MLRADRDYLRSLVRMDIRKKERSLAVAAPRRGQPWEEFVEFRDKVASNLAFRREVLQRLTEGEADEVEEA